MSGETGEMTVEGNSVESGLIWADNPELAYFRSMMTNRMDERVGSGLDGDDSLIRKPTIRGILKVGDDDESNSTRSNSFPLRHIGVRDTSGLNDVETDTVDNIYIEDESILEVNETNDKVLLKDETLEPQDNKEVVLATKITPPERIPYQHQDRIQAANRHSHQQSNNQDTGPLPPLPFQRYSIGEDVVVTKQFPGNIPGMIFVTNGHSSIIETRTHEQSDKHIKKDDKDYCRRKKEKQIWRSLIIFVLAFLVVVATTVAVLVARNERKLSSSNSSSSSSSSSSSPSMLSVSPFVSGSPSSSFFESSSFSSSSSENTASSSASNGRGSFTGYRFICTTASRQRRRTSGWIPRESGSAPPPATLFIKSFFRTGLNLRAPSCRTASVARPMMRVRSPGAAPEISRASLQVQPFAQAATTSTCERSNWQLQIFSSKKYCLCTSIKRSVPSRST
mmetsp:Transcript_25087/g.52010  ORF Transcript_25087/g.52010 Transcript_25087/m.52010 type:complete len:450 (-) Transcript_25087:1387-2736(-)